MKRRRSRKKNTGAPKWMVTYSDMVTLILVFFILLFSMSQVDLAKFKTISESFRNRIMFDFDSSSQSLNQLNDYELPEKVLLDLNREENDSLGDLMTSIETYLDENDLNGVISANRTDRGVVLVLQESVLFNSGEAEILDKGKPFLKEIGNLLTQIPNQVKVEGHTDDRPISNYRYPSNWELSGARSSRVIQFLVTNNNFSESRFSSVGYGDTRPIAKNDSQENWSKNRRVEIVILEEGADPDEDVKK